MGVPAQHAVYLQRKDYVPPWPGAFTSEEVALLARFGHWMHALASGEITPVTAEQRHFVAVAHSETVAETPFERVWTKLQQQKPPAEPEPAPLDPPAEPLIEPPLNDSPARTKFEELIEAKQYLEQLRQLGEAEREAILYVVRAQLDALDARLKPELENAQHAVEELEAEVRAEVVKTGKSARLGNIQATYYRGRVTWDGKGLQQYAETHPELQQFRKVGQPGVAIRYQ